MGNSARFGRIVDTLWSTVVFAKDLFQFNDCHRAEHGWHNLFIIFRKGVGKKTLTKKILVAAYKEPKAVLRYVGHFN